MCRYVAMVVSVGSFSDDCGLTHVGAGVLCKHQMALLLVRLGKFSLWVRSCN